MRNSCWISLDALVRAGDYTLHRSTTTPRLLCNPMYRNFMQGRRQSRYVAVHCWTWRGTSDVHGSGTYARPRGVRAEHQIYELTSLPISRKTPFNEMDLEFRHLDHYPARNQVFSVLDTILHAFPLQTPICSGRNTAVLVVPLIVPFMVSSTALCLHLTALRQS
jgi:hypothetical protein